MFGRYFKQFKEILWPNQQLKRRFGIYMAAKNIAVRPSFLSYNKRQACCRGSVWGIQASTEQLVAQVADYVAQGYQRVKIKIKPGVDLEPLIAVRETFPELVLMADANGAYEDQPEKDSRIR